MIDWELQIKNAESAEYVVVPFATITLNEKSGMDVTGMSIKLGDKVGYFFSWIQNSSELKLFKNGMEHFHGYITDIRAATDSDGDDITIVSKNYWHYILKRRLTTFERFGKISNINPTELAKVAIGIKTYISDADWEADKIAALRFGSVSTDTTGDIELAMGVRNESYYTLMNYLRSVRWRVDEPDWQGSSDMKSVSTTVSETLSGGTSYFWFSRDDGETWYNLVKSASTPLNGSESVKNRGKYKIEVYGDFTKEENTVYNAAISNFSDGSPNTQQVIRTADGTLHTCLVRTTDFYTVEHWTSRDNGKTWAKYGNSLLTQASMITDFCIACTPSGHIGIVTRETTADVIRVFLRRRVSKEKGTWEWDTGYALSASSYVATAGSLSMNGVSLHNGTDWEENFMLVWQATGGTIGVLAYTVPDTGVPLVKWSSILSSTTGNIEHPVIWCHKNWGRDADAKRVMFIARSGAYGDATRTCQIKYATYTSGGTPVWSGSWVTVDIGSCYSVDMLSDRIHHTRVEEDYKIYVWYKISGSVYCKSSPVDDLSTWTALPNGLVGSVKADYWDVSQLADRNFLISYVDVTDDDLYAEPYRNSVGGWFTRILLSTNHVGAKMPQESLLGFGEVVSFGSVLDSYLLYSTIEPTVTAMTLGIVTESETGILEGNMDSYVNAGLDDENVDYSMNRETRLAMLQNIQKMMPVAAGSSSPYPFWDIAIRVENGIAYLDVAEELGDVKEVIITHEDEGEGDVQIKMLEKTIDRGEIINALTLVGGGWSSGGIEVIPTKNVATAEVEAGTVVQLAGTVINKRQSTDLTIENIAYGILNITKTPRITIGLAAKGDARNLFGLNDRITVISERADIDETLKVRGMHWSITNKGTKLRLTLDNGAQTLDKYMVEIVSNVSSLGYSSQGDITRPPIFLNKNFSKDEPATLNFYVPTSKKTTKALLYIKTQKYTSYENSIINEFGYYPYDVRVFVDGNLHEGFGGRGDESTAVNIRGMDITSSLDEDGNGLVDSGSHTLRITSTASTNNLNGIGRVEAYLVLLETEK